VPPDPEIEKIISSVVEEAFQKCVSLLERDSAHYNEREVV
jgi:hypothetical protein